MTDKEIDLLWGKALHESVAAGEMFTRYRFAALVAAAEREECAEIAMEVGTNTEPTDFALDRCYEIADKIRGRK